MCPRMYLVSAIPKKSQVVPSNEQEQKIRSEKLSFVPWGKNTA